ncbi:MAG: Maf family protein [Pseudomonadota bacterium]
MIANSVYLASQSPRRGELLSQIGIHYERLSNKVCEKHLPDESPEQLVLRLAVSKAQAGWAHGKRQHFWPVIGSDTIVHIENTVFGKPDNNEEAKAMLRQLSGRSHQVKTAVAVVLGKRLLTKNSDSRVYFHTLSDDDINDYVESGESLDKAGAYGIQGMAGKFVERIEGSYSGIVGLPLDIVSGLVKEVLASSSQ